MNFGSENQKVPGVLAYQGRASILQRDGFPEANRRPITALAGRKNAENAIGMCHENAHFGKASIRIADAKPPPRFPG